MEKWRKRAVDLLTSLALGSRDDPAVIPYTPAKTRLPSKETRYFKRSAPEKFGISSKRLYAMLCELEGESRANIHSLMVVSNGEVICECSQDGYDVNMWHLSHSMTKSVTAMVVGILVDEGRLCLDEKIADIFPELVYKDKRFPSITVEHLLTMTSGVSFNEAGSVTEERWCESYFRSSLKFTPGTRFQYNSMNSYMLARIVERRSGDSFSKYAEEKLFRPLAIDNYFWEKSPEGTEKGGWGLFISAESCAKLGVLFLCRGEFFGKRIISKNWIEKTGETWAKSPEISGDFNYGYHTWTARNSSERLFNGMLGQDVWICPQNNIVAVINSGNDELFQESAALEIIRKNLGGEIRDELSRECAKILRKKEEDFFDSRRWVHPKERKRGILTLFGIKSATPYDSAWDGIVGVYAFGSNNVGILPLIVRTMQNNLNSYLEKLKIYRSENSVYISFRESGADYVLEVGLYEYKTAVIDYRGEKYIVRTMGEAFVNPDGVSEYRIVMLFPELPNTRMIRFVRVDDDKVRFEFFEVPNDRIVENIINRISEINKPLSFIVDLIEKRFGRGIIVTTVRRTFSPVLFGADMSRENYREIVKEETRRVEDESGVVRLIRGLVDKFFKVSVLEEGTPADENNADDKTKTRSLVGEIINKIRNKK